ncbi:hypothetical protein ACWDV7_35485 [Streptomyces sp. NPDC003362]
MPGRRYAELVGRRLDGLLLDITRPREAMTPGAPLRGRTVQRRRNPPSRGRRLGHLSPPRLCAGPSPAGRSPGCAPA